MIALLGCARSGAERATGGPAVAGAADGLCRAFYRAVRVVVEYHSGVSAAAIRLPGIACAPLSIRVGADSRDVRSPLRSDVARRPS